MTAESKAAAQNLATPLIRVEKGRAEPEELAAITTLILVAAASRSRLTTCADSPRRLRPHRRLPGYRAPRSWQTPES
jgi:hypothetical protein